MAPTTCPNCGHPVDPEVLHCPNCGAPITSREKAEGVRALGCLPWSIALFAAAGYFAGGWVGLIVGAGIGLVLTLATWRLRS